MEWSALYYNANITPFLLFPSPFSSPHFPANCTSLRQLTYSQLTRHHDPHPRLLTMLHKLIHIVHLPRPPRPLPPHPPPPPRHPAPIPEPVHVQLLPPHLPDTPLQS